MPIILEDSNGSNSTPWRKNTVSQAELVANFVGALGGLRKKSDNSVVLPDGNGIFPLVDGETYKVMVPVSSGKLIFNISIYSINDVEQHVF